MKLLDIGFGNYVAIEKIVAIIDSNSTPTRKLASAAKDNLRYLDVTHGRKTRSFIVTSDYFIIGSSNNPNTLCGRLHDDH